MSDLSVPLHDYAEDAYLEYAIATVKGRALSNVQDGLKPVQRRILYTLDQLRLGPQAKPVKSARIVGEVLGKYHPHGDQAAYDAMVRMGQDFSLRYPLIDKQGNFGSRDGDSAAAMRYTEARLSRFANLLLEELGEGTVDFKSNYDGSFEEPVLLPSRLPMLLLNGMSGIAVGMAADIPSHNLTEIAAACELALLRPHALGLDEILEKMPGPDFATGGHVVSSPKTIRDAYTSGRGSLRVRCVWEKEELARNQWQLVVTELPPQVSTKKILEQIDALSNPQPPSGKKSITPQQAGLRQMALELLDSARDESGKDQDVRIVLSPKTSKVDIEALKAFLLVNTSLEDSVTVNMTCIDLEGRPRTLGLVEILAQWASFRIQTFTRKCQWQVQKLEARKHILQGRMKALLDLDAVITTIREADDPSAQLQADFQLSQLQAEDILAMRLRQLNKLEVLEVERELSGIEKELERLNALLADEKAMRKELARQVREDAKTYGDERRTVLQEETVDVSRLAVSVPDEPVQVVLSKNLWIRAYKESATEWQFKSGDEMLLRAAGRTIRPMVLLDDSGRAYTLDLSTLPLKGDGIPLTSLIELKSGARPIALLSLENTAEVLIASSDAYGFVTTFDALVSRMRAGKEIVGSLPDTELAAYALQVPSNARWLVCGGDDGRMLAFELSEVKRLKKGRGVVLMDTGRLTGLDFSEEPPRNIVDTEGNVHKLKEAEKYVLKRARKGAFLPKKAKFFKMHVAG